MKGFFYFLFSMTFKVMTVETELWSYFQKDHQHTAQKKGI